LLSLTTSPFTIRHPVQCVKAKSLLKTLVPEGKLQIHELDLAAPIAGMSGSQVQQVRTVLWRA
jgi:hypothetical protein